MSDDTAPKPGDRDAGVCSTSEAARLLGVSSTTVQMMVERGELEAWRTAGGHRRISRVSIERLKTSRVPQGTGRANDGRLEILLVEDDLTLRTLYLKAIESWKLPVRIAVAGDGMEALMMIERQRPDLLISDLRMEPVDGFRLLRMLREHHEFDAMVVIAVTAMTQAEITEKGGLPKGVVVYEKPAPLDKLQGFVESSLTRKQLGTH